MKNSLLACLTATVLAAPIGCSGKLRHTGFLSDYSKLEKVEEGRLLYFDNAKVGTFTRYLVDPVKVYFHDKAKGRKTDPEKLREFEQLAHGALIREISDGYTVVAQPGPGVARIRIALTDVQKDSPALNAIPHTRMTGVGLGRLSMEGEVIDTETGRQVAAVIQSRKGSTISLEGFTDWSSVEAAIDKWAKVFREKIDKAHGR